MRKKKEIPVPGFERIDNPWPIHKDDPPADKVVKNHHLRLPTISQDKLEEIQAKGITVKRHIQNWLDDNEFNEGIPNEELNQISAMMIGEELFPYNLEHTFVDDQDENGDTVIWSEFFVGVMKDENARLLK